MSTYADVRAGVRLGLKPSDGRLWEHLPARGDRGPALLVATMPTERALLARIAVAFALAFLLGFERELRGTPAGDRTYALVGTAAAAVTGVCFDRSPQAIAGVLTGIGFIGAGMVFRP